MSADSQIKKQAVGTYGEKVVEARLLRQGWVPANVNDSVKNAAEFDIIAQKAGRFVPLRIKTCGPGQRVFQFAVRPGDRMSLNLRPNDYTVLVSMGQTSKDDEFYLVPTIEVRKAVNAHIDEYLAKKSRKGEERKDTGQWTLYLRSLRSGEDRHSHGYEDKWHQHKNDWGALDRVAT
jgi:hypothetical protein